MSPILKFDFQKRKQLRFSEVDYIKLHKKQGETRTSSGPIPHLLRGQYTLWGSKCLFLECPIGGSPFLKPSHIWFKSYCNVKVDINATWKTSEWKTTKHLRKIFSLVSCFSHSYCLNSRVKNVLKVDVQLWLNFYSMFNVQMVRAFFKVCLFFLFCFVFQNCQIQIFKIKNETDPVKNLKMGFFRSYDIYR